MRCFVGPWWIFVLVVFQIVMDAVDESTRSAFIRAQNAMLCNGLCDLRVRCLSRPTVSVTSVDSAMRSRPGSLPPLCVSEPLW